MPNQLLYQQKRFRGKINLRKPKIYIKKRILNELLTPFFVNPREGVTIDQLCIASTKKPERTLNAYEKIIAKEVRNWFDTSKMVALVHVNSIKQEVLFDTLVPLRRANMYYKWYSPKIVRAAIEGSNYESIDPVISDHTSYIFSPDLNVVALEKILKKCPQLFTLGGILLGHVLHHDDFIKFGNLDITSVQVDLVQTLQNAGGANLNRQLTYHQNTLVSRLKQIGTNESSTNEKE